MFMLLTMTPSPAPPSPEGCAAPRGARAAASFVRTIRRFLPCALVQVEHPHPFRWLGSEHQRGIDAGGVVVAVAHVLAEGGYRVPGHEVDGTAAEAAAGHARPEAAGA